ncbi:thioesterase-like superfamily-domain-containing protein [Aspergillus pseudoustus]|uniref:Thioesterase-like superfamily-domain-containing protein n=1 Tax=Aspergillus pseudoustus TaxID=1810923 RepID=A0ABR4K5D5_9EURO
MTDAHIPNAEATPGWRELPFPKTSFDDAIKIAPVDGVAGLYKAFGPRDWSLPHDNGLSLHGGYLCSLLISGSREYARATGLVELNQPDPLSMHVQFLDLAPQGPLHVRFTTLKSGSRSSVVQGEVCTAQSTTAGSDPRKKTYTLAICTMGNLNDKSGISLELPPHGPLPSRETDCVRWTDAFAFFTSPPTAACRVYTPKGGPTPLWSPAVGQNRRDQWGKLDNGENFRLEHLGLLADIVAVIPINYQREGMKSLIKFNVPSVSLTFDFVQDPAGQKEWILNRATMNRLQNGRFDMDLLMIDEEGRLVAAIKHQSLMFERKRHLGGQDQKEEEKKKKNGEGARL